MFLAVLWAIAFFCFWEYRGIVAAHGLEPPGPTAFAAGLAILAVPREFVLPVVFALLFLSLALRVDDLRKYLPSTGALVLGLFYVFGSWRMASELRLLNPYWLFFALALNWAGDTAAYYTGRAWGRHKLAPGISPGKTLEGSAGSILASVIFGIVYAKFLLPGVAPWEAAVVAAAGNIAGQLGDLVESAMKRGAGLKDSGNLLPGHGGWLDRVDSSLFSVPTVFVIVMRLGLH
jgi:phosphatidate cytidylyltransferase